MRLDMSEFEQSLDRLGDDLPRVGVEALGKAALQLLNDAVMQPPTVPLDEGTLRASGSVHINGEIEAVSPHGQDGTPNEDMDETSSQYGEGRGVLRATVGFNTPYAAVQHERDDFNHTEPQSGSGYLVKKAKRNAKLYREIMARVFRTNLRR